MVIFVKLLARFMALWPVSVSRGMARAMGFFLSRVIRLRRKSVLDALEKSFPDMTPRDRLRLYREVCAQQMLTLVEVLRHTGGRPDEFSSRLHVEGAERAQEAHHRGKGVLVLIAHYGNYALLAMHVQRLFGYPLSVVSKRMRSAFMTELWFNQLKQHGCTTIEAKNAYRACCKALHRQEMVGFMLDQNRPFPSGVFVDFFGRPASTTPGLALLSAQTKAPVLPVFMRRAPDGTHWLQALPCIEPPPDHHPETILRYTARYTKLIEDQIRAYPEQWLWWHKRWKSQPPPEEKPTAEDGGLPS